MQWAINAIEARRGIRQGPGRRHRQPSRHQRRIIRHTRNARRACAKSLLIARIKGATRTLIRGGEKRAMQRRFIRKPRIADPKRVP